jgi:light-harvesting protein B-800-850 alpha chain
MNQGRIWCVVSPTVGLPLFLGSIAVTALIVHYAVLSHTSWYPAYWGGSKAKVAVESSAAKTDAAFSITVAPTSAGAANSQAFVITVSPNAVTAASAGAATEGTTVAAIPVHAASTN